MKNKGITLIALIVTVIIMIILVGVSLNLILNGGIIDKTRVATRDTQAAMDSEILQLAVAAAKNPKTGTIDLEVLEQNLDGWTNIDVSSDGIVTATSPKGSQYSVAASGGVSGGETNQQQTVDRSAELIKLKNYFVGENLSELIGNTDTDAIWEILEEQHPDEEIEYDEFFSMVYTFIDKDNVKGSDIQYLTSIEEGVRKEINGERKYYTPIFIKYNNAGYMIEAYSDDDEDLSTKVFTNVELVYEPSGMAGQIVKYAPVEGGPEDDWIVLYDNGNTLQLATMEPERFGEFEIGEDGNFEKSLSDYNNLIDILNNQCESVITNPSARSVRSVGTNPTNPSEDNSRMYNENWLEQAKPEYNGVFKVDDDNFKYDMCALAYWKKFALKHLVEYNGRMHEEELEYFMASRCLSIKRNEYIRLGAIEAYGFWIDTDSFIELGIGSDYKNVYTTEGYLRPVVTVDASLFR